MNKQHKNKSQYGQDKCLGMSRENKRNDFTIFNDKDMDILPGMMSHFTNTLILC